ncbi:hypothetical protein AC578_8270 [Pseudocercospora eumusae]|uniref:ABC transporter n=1 Tax=Pseudocercospora eumusae TaxID=321146 RepID=A0A139HE44_9PEZI|nr:hypothetical protein AC578_8270 [Pseudocercospora eumusae]
MAAEKSKKHGKHSRNTSNESNTGSVATDSSTYEQQEAAPWRALFAFTTRRNVPLLAFGIIVSVAAGAASPAQSLVVGELFDGFTRYATGTLENKEFMDRESKYVLYLTIIAAGSWILHSLEFMSWLAFGELQAKSARDRLFYGLLDKEVEWYDMRKNGIGAQLPRMQAQIRELQLASAQPLGSMFALASTAILSLVQAFVKSWKLTLVTLASSPVILALAMWAGNGMQKNLLKQQEKLTEAQKYSTSAFAAIETVKCFNGQGIERDKYFDAIAKAARWYGWVAHSSALQMAFVVMLSVSMFVQGFYYGGVLIGQGDIDSGDVVTTFFSAIGAFQAIQGILPQMIVLEKGRTAGHTLRKIMASVEDKSLAEKKDRLLSPVQCKGDIEVRGLTFAYPSRKDILAVQDINLQIRSGEITFLIGRSGSGKSTISQLLMRFYTSPPETIFVDGLPLESLDTAWLRTNVTLVEQTSLLFNDTMFRNIAFGRGEHYSEVQSEEVLEAVQFALLQLMINDMPQGLDTMVGFKGGNMSGGQRQRVALARARIRDTPVLILDESTSALDHITRTLIMEAIRRWRQGKTTIIITHDISQITPDDYIYLLENSRLVQEGYRKHMEKMKGTPFQDFLSEEEKMLNSPLVARQSTNEESLMDTDSLESLPIYHDRSGSYFDPLDAELTRTETKINRQSKLPNVFQEGSPMPMMRAYQKGPTSAFASPWMRLAGNVSPVDTPGIGQKRSPPSPTQTTPSDRSTPGGARWSQAFEKLVNQTGMFAAEARRPVSGATRKRRPLQDIEEIPLTGPEDALAKLEGGGEPESDIEDNNKKLKVIFRTLWPNLSWQARVVLIFGWLGATIHAVSSPVFSFVLSKLLETYAIPGGAKSKQLVYALAILGISLVDATGTYIYRLLLEVCGQWWVDAVRLNAYERILDQSRDFFEKEENGVSRLTESLDRNAEEMRNLLGRFAALTYVAALMTFVSLAWAMSSQWKMTLIALSIAPYIFGVTKVFAAVSEKWEGLSNDASETASAIFTETFTNIKTVRALTLEKHFLDKYVKATDHTLRVGFKRSAYAGFFFGLSDSAGAFSTAMIMYVGAKFVTQGVAVKDVLQVFTMLIFTITNVSAILGFIPQIGSSKDTASRLLRLAKLPKDSHEHLGDTRITTVGDIVLDNLVFRYPSRPEQTILKNINLRLKPNTVTAIVGGSGSGKSTIANLLLDLYSTATVPGSKLGDLTFGGRDIKHIYTPSLRAMIVPVSQTPTLFAATVSENIAYGLPKDHPCNTPAQISSAAQAATIHEFILSLPQAYNTPIGEGGIGLSGGQAQRIAIARALVRNPSVLILDEATSALDVESSNMIRQTIRDLVEDRSREITIIIITHHKDMMEMAERVVVLDQGRISEEGGFEELMRKKGGALNNLLSGGEWNVEDHEAEGRRPVSVMRRKGRRDQQVPLLKDVDWSRKKNGGRDGRRGGGAM